MMIAGLTLHQKRRCTEGRREKDQVVFGQIDAAPRRGLLLEVFLTRNLQSACLAVTLSTVWTITAEPNAKVSKPTLSQIMYLYVIQVESASGCSAESRFTIVHALAHESTGFMHPIIIGSSNGICPD